MWGPFSDFDSDSAFIGGEEAGISFSFSSDFGSTVLDGRHVEGAGTIGSGVLSGIAGAVEGGENSSLTGIELRAVGIPCFSNLSRSFNSYLTYNYTMIV